MNKKSLKNKIILQKITLNLLLKFLSPRNKFVIYISQSLDKRIWQYQHLIYKKYKRKHSNKYSICESLQIQLINKIELPVTDRINLFLQIHDGIDNDTIKTFLISLGNPYDEIANPKKSPKIKRNSLNSVFMNILIQKGIITSYSEKTNQVYHSKKDIER